MLLTEHLPGADERWKDLLKKEMFWLSWKKLYKAAERKAKVKKQAVGVQDQFGTAHGALRQAPEPDQENQENGTNMSATDLNKYFDALAATATTYKTVMEELVRVNASLTTTNAKLLDSVDSLIKANNQLYRQVGNRQAN